MKRYRQASAVSFQRRTQSGITGFIEIAASAIFLVVIALLAMDICLAIIGASMNDHACRDAARAASGAQSRAKALSMAQAALSMYRPDGFFISQPALVSTSQPEFEYNDYGGAPPPDTSPYVTVTTKCDVRIPAPVFFMGATFINNGKASFVQRYTFPIVRTQLIRYTNAS
jgi:hypothetical protein